VPEGSNILSDCIGSLPKRQAKSRKNPYTKPVREVRVRLDTGALIRVVSNNLDAPAEHIAALYKRRWAIELFFRWIKQNLSIRHLFGHSENALRIQIAVALIVFLLLRLAHGAQRAIPHLQTFVRLVRVNLMHRREINRMLDDDPVPPPRQTPQLQFAWG
jgi:transposase